MRVLLAEWYSGSLGKGSSLGLEGAFMLQTLARTFLGAGNKVCSILHRSLEGFLPPEVETVPGEGGFERVLKNLLKTCDAALVLAPETGGKLARLTRMVEEQGKWNLGSASEGIPLAQNKDETLAVLQQRGIPVPETWLVDTPRDVPALAASVGYPLVIKPRDGAGSQKIFLVKNKGELQRSLNYYSEEPVLVQEYLQGEDASVTILGNERAAYPLSFNAQELDGSFSFRYLGGVVGWRHPGASRALRVAQAAWESLGGLQGFGGVDLVLCRGDAYVVEINPRPTTPLCALAEAVEENLAQLLLEVLSGKGVPPLTWRYPVRFRLQPGGIEFTPCLGIIQGGNWGANNPTGSGGVSSDP